IQKLMISSSFGPESPNYPLQGVVVPGCGIKLKRVPQIVGIASFQCFVQNRRYFGAIITRLDNGLAYVKWFAPFGVNLTAKLVQTCEFARPISVSIDIEQEGSSIRTGPSSRVPIFIRHWAESRVFRSQRPKRCVNGLFLRTD